MPYSLPRGSTYKTDGLYMQANGQLSRKTKVVREPKSLMDMVIPWESYINPS